MTHAARRMPFYFILFFSGNGAVPDRGARRWVLVNMHPAIELGNRQLGDPAEEKLVRNVRATDVMLVLVNPVARAGEGNPLGANGSFLVT